MPVHISQEEYLTSEIRAIDQAVSDREATIASVPEQIARIEAQGRAAEASRADLLKRRELIMVEMNPAISQV